MNSPSRFAVALLGVAFAGVNYADACGCGCCRQPAAANPMPAHFPAVNGAPAANTMQMTLAVSGMSCASCAAKVQKALMSVPGVIQVQVDVRIGRALVTVQADKCDESALVKSVEKAGYVAKVVK